MASIPNEFIQKLRDEADLVEYIRSTGLELKKSGAEFAGLCPFHADKSPSLNVNPVKNVFLCRGCGQGGDVIKYIELSEGTKFTDSIEILANFMGLQIPKPSQPESQIDREKAELVAILERARIHYQKELLNSPETIAYLRKRGVDQALSEKFGLGYAPSGNFIQKAMKDVPVSKLVKAGLIHESSITEGKMVDRMYDRLIFPIRNPSGKTIAFGGRTMKDDNKGRKYVNTNETLLFTKGNEAYGFYEGLSAIRKSSTAIVTEGYMDVVIPNGRGVENIVSAMGTALTQTSIQKLFRSVDNIVFCFDGDQAGRTAAVRAMNNVIKVIDAHHTAKFCFLPDGMDPDEYVIKYGAEKFKELVDNALPLSQYMIKEMSSRVEMDTAEGRARFTVDTMALANNIQHPILKNIIFDEIRSTIGYHIPIPGLEAPTFKMPESSEYPEPVRRRGFAKLHKEAEEENNAPPRPVSLGMRVLSMLMAMPEAAKYFEPHWLETVKSSDEEIAAVSAVINTVKIHKEPLTTEDLIAQFSGSEIESLITEATNLEERKINANVALQLTEIVNFLSDQQTKMAKVSSLVQRKMMP